MPHRLLLVFALAVLPAFPVSKEMLQLQRDVAQLQDQLNKLQSSFDERLAVTQQLLNQNLNAANGLSTRFVVLEKGLQDQAKSMAAPLADTNARVDSLTGQFQALRDAIQEMNSKLSKLQQQLADIKNIVSTVPPPAASSTALTPSQPQAQSPSALLQGAMKDYQAGNYNLAGPEFTQYLQLYGTTDQAVEAQFYLGQIFYENADFGQAVEAFDKVLERYPEGPRTPDAQYKKGLSLLKQGKRDMAVREFRGVRAKYPNSPAAKLAADQLRGLGLSAGAAPAKTSKAARRK